MRYSSESSHEKDPLVKERSAILFSARLRSFSLPRFCLSFLLFQLPFSLTFHKPPRIGSLAKPARAKCSKELVKRIYTFRTPRFAAKGIWKRHLFGARREKRVLFFRTDCIFLASLLKSGNAYLAEGQHWNGTSSQPR